MSNARGLSWVLRGTLGARSTFSAVRFQWVEARMDQVTARFKDQLFSSPDEIRILDQLAEWNRQHLDARYASAQLYNPRSRHLHVVAQREFASTLIGQFQDLPLTSGTVCARAGRLQRPILVPDVTADSDWTPFLSFSEAAGFGGVLSFRCCPGQAS